MICAAKIAQRIQADGCLGLFHHGGEKANSEPMDAAVTHYKRLNQMWNQLKDVVKKMRGVIYSREAVLVGVVLVVVARALGWIDEATVELIVSVLTALL